MLFEPGFDHEDWALPTAGSLDGDGGPPTIHDWLVTAFDRRVDDLIDPAIPERPPLMPDGFDLDLPERKLSDGFVMFGEDPPVTKVGDITVPAPDDEDDDGPPPWWETGGPPPGEGPDWPVDGGGGGGEPQPPVDPDRPYDACEDRAADTLAQEINNEISAQPDSDRREYAALIWRDDAGNLHRTALIPGNNFQVNFDGALRPELGFTSFGQVVGVVHNHPTQIESAPGVGDWQRVEPTWNFQLPWAGDWVSAHDFVTASNASAANFTLYISYEGQVREFDWSDNQHQSRDVSNYAGSGIESNDYAPGTTCAP